jgi:hypothetical protein
MQRFHVTQGLLSTAMIAFTGFAACAEVDTADAPGQPPMERLVASQRSGAELGVATWEIATDGPESRVIGRDAGAARRVEMIVRRDAAAPDDRVQIEVAFPERGELRVTRAGLADPPPSEYLQHLGADVYADLGQGTAQAVQAPGLGSVTSALAAGDPRINDQDVIHIGYDLFGHGTVATVSGACHAGSTRDHIEVYADYAFNGSTATSGWAFMSPDTDCLAKLTLWVPGGHWDDFHWRVYNRPVNLAAFRPANQSSNPFGAGPERAVDTNADGNWNDSSVTHTNFDTQAWWQVDLGIRRNIGAVVLFNRTDCCSDRLSNFQVLVSDDGASWVSVANYLNQAPSRTEFLMNTWGRFVRVQLNGTNYLSLAEVQVFAP